MHGALPGQHDEIDAAKRQAFEENFQLIKKCWTQELVSQNGKYWSVPADGTPWDIPATNMYGKGIGTFYLLNPIKRSNQSPARGEMAHTLFSMARMNCLGRVPKNVSLLPADYRSRAAAERDSVDRVV